MINRFTAGLAISIAVCASAHAGTSQQHLFPDHNYSQFTLPSVGVTSSEVSRLYGEPSNRQQGANGVDVWDYGSFRVIFRDNTVSYAAMW